MYSEKLVTVIKHNGRVLRETDGAVHIPFGSEYTLLFKNLNSVRALVRVSIDGQDATKGTSLIVPANSSVELERFLEVGKMDKGHRFKFIERTKKIEDGPRGVGVEDGLVRVEFEFEELQAFIKPPSPIYTAPEKFHDYRFHPTYPMNPTVPWNPYTRPGEITCASKGSNLGDVLNVQYSTLSSGVKGVAGDTVVAQAYNASAPRALKQAVDNDVGITVKGEVSDQKFYQGQWFKTDGQKHVMVLKLLGYAGGTVVKKPVTTKTKQVCETCGTKNRTGTKFCRECGTSLVQLT